MVTYDQIKETMAFKALSAIQQKLIINGNTRRAIEHGVNLVKNIGVEQFQAQTSYNYNTEQIVLELANNL